jgi:hypothetical protein
MLHIDTTCFGLLRPSSGIQLKTLGRGRGCLFCRDLYVNSSLSRISVYYIAVHGFARFCYSWGGVLLVSSFTWGLLGVGWLSTCSCSLYSLEWWSTSRPGRFTAWKNAVVYWKWGWVQPRARVDGFIENKISCHCRDSNYRPSRAKRVATLFWFFIIQTFVGLDSKVYNMHCTYIKIFCFLLTDFKIMTAFAPYLQEKISLWHNFDDRCFD